MKKIYYIVLFVMVSTLACTSGFDNINPNKPIEGTPGLLLPTIIHASVNTIANDSWHKGTLMAQYTALNNFTDFDAHQWGSNGYWESAYDNLRDINALLEISKTEDLQSYKAVALIIKAWTFANITDLYGDAPFFEASKGKSDGVYQAKYDTQANIYKGILSDLKTANDLLKKGKQLAEGDLVFNGDVKKWRKLANSLRVRYLIRKSSKENISDELKLVLKEPIFESNKDNAFMAYGASRPNTWPLHTSRIGSFDKFRLSDAIAEPLKKFKDNRLQRWFTPTPLDKQVEGSVEPYSSMPNGLSQENAQNYKGGPAFVSMCDSIFYYEPNAVDAIIMNYSELQFLLAEASKEGWISGNAKNYYDNGVKASFAYWKVDQDMDAYLSQNGVKYDGKLETIITQKWLSSFLNGYEGYFDFRRTGFPTYIKAAKDSKNNNQIPVRFLYPDNQQTLNKKNYDEVIARQGPNDINTKMWLIK